MDRRLIVAAFAGAIAFMGGCGSRGVTTPTPSGLSTSIKAIAVTTALDCQAQMQGRNSYALFPLRVEDNGKTYTMVSCQALDALLLHPGRDGCRWTTVQSSDETVLAILPIPFPAPPEGGTNEAYIALTSGHATLTSSLACQSGVSARWAVTVSVTR